MLENELLYGIILLLGIHDAWRKHLALMSDWKVTNIQYSVGFYDLLWSLCTVENNINCLS